MNIFERKPWIVLLIVLAVLCIAGEADYKDRVLGIDITGMHP